MADYQLYYWPQIQGRGEFVRLVLEDAGASYVDVARLPEDQGGGVTALMALLDRSDIGTPPFAPPILKHGDLYIGQTATICRYLGNRHGLAPAREDDRWRAEYLQLTLADFVDEIHDVHHPIAGSLYYEDQAVEALRRADSFRNERLPRYLGYFERVIVGNERSDADWLVGDECTHVDLALFQIVAGLTYAFPNVLREARATYPRVLGVHDRVAQRPNIAAYLDSERRLPFSEHGVFRHYPELDA